MRAADISLDSGGSGKLGARKHEDGVTARAEKLTLSLSSHKIELSDQFSSISFTL